MNGTNGQQGGYGGYGDQNQHAQSQAQQAQARVMSDNEEAMLPVGGDFEAHPEGAFVGQIVEVKDLGLMQTAYGPKERYQFTIRCVSRSAPRREDGDVHRVNMRVNKAAGSRARLTEVRQAAMGRTLTKDEMGRFRVSDVIRKFVNYSVSHRIDGDNLWANVTSISQLTVDQKAQLKAGAKKTEAQPEAPADGADKDLPF